MRGEVWGIDGSLFTADFLAAFEALGLSTRLVTREEADQAGVNGPPPAFVLDIKIGLRTLGLLGQRNIPYIAVSLDQWYNSPRLFSEKKRHAGRIYVFTCAPEQIPAFQRLGFHHAEFLPFGVDTGRFKPMDLAPGEKHRLGGAVSFVGTALLNNPIDGYLILKRDLAALKAQAPPAQAEAHQRMLDLLEELVTIQSRDLFTYRIPQLMQELEWKHKVTFLAEGMTPAKETWAIQIGVHLSMMQRVEVVRKLAAETGIVVYGSEDWKTLDIPGMDYRGTADHQTLLPRVVNASDVNINVSKIMFDTAVGPRVFETLACGGFLLTNRTTALTTFFVDGKDLVIYDDLDDLAGKTRYYLGHPEERRVIAERGRRKVHAHHSWLHRAKRIVDVLEEDGIIVKRPSADSHPCR